MPASAMDEQRIQAYLSLIQELLSCFSGEEPQVLERHPELIDQGLVQVCELVAQQLQGAGRENEAEFLLNLGQQVAESLNYQASPASAIDEQRIQAYLSLIQKLVSCPSGEESQILNQHPELIDQGLVQMCELVAQQLQGEGRENEAEFLLNLGQQVAESLNYQASGGGGEPSETQPNATLEDYLRFLIALLQAVFESDNDPQVVYPLLAQYQDKLDLTFAKIVQLWFESELDPNNSEQNQFLAAILNSLAVDMCQFPLGSRANNLEIAIACYQAAQELTRQAFPQNWAMTQNNLGAAYSDRIQGERAENLELAIACYQAALQVLTRQAFPQQWAATQNNLGIAYHERIQGKRANNLELAIAFYQGALQVRTRQAFPQDWAMTQNNLGAAYSARIQGARAENLELAIACYQAALQVLTRQAFPQQWAATQNNLGNAYRDRIQGKRAENLELAIAYYQAALQVRTRQAFPQDWAMTQNNLGIAYSDRIQGERAENLELAIACYQAALQVHTRQAFPQDWAATQNNLGNAYNNRIQGERAENLELAIAFYQAALQVRTRQAFPQDWAGTHNNLGAAYRDRIQGKRAENLELAIACYQAALQVYTPQAFPQDWAMTQNNLGTAYSARIQGERAENLELAIAFYQAALQVRTPQAFPQQWAMTQNNLGTAYNDRIQGKRAENLELAIACYEEALQVLTRQAFPQNHTATLNNLGLAYIAQSIHYTTNSTQKQTALENAYRTFAQAIDSVEYLRGEITSGDEAKRKLNEEWNRLYRSMVEVCLELGNDSAAIEYADRSKARNLVELIAIRAAYPQGIPVQVRQRLQQLPLQIDKENRRLAQDPNPDYTHITQLRQEFQEKSPYKPLDFQQIQSLLDQETTILEWYILGDKFLTFILTPQTLHLWQSTPEDRKNLSDWLSEYLVDYQTNKTQWQNRLSQRLEALAKILHLEDILQSLFDKFPTCKKLILIPHGFLHLFPIHALPVHLPSPSEIEGKPLQEWFPNGVSYAPSCQLLQQAQNRQRPDFNQLFAIQNPTQDLAFTDIEVEAIQSYFNPHHVLKHDKAEKTALNLNNAHCTHFSCHGYFNFNDPLKSALLLANSEFLPPAPDEDQTRYIPLQNGNLLDLGKCLTLEDILRLDLRNCRLVTLSACETGITDFTSTSDEYIGLPSGFILAGSPNVVSSLWAVNDLSTALLMIRFYENLKQWRNRPPRPPTRPNLAAKCYRRDIAAVV